MGLTLAALLAWLGVASLVIEADAGHCSGSRAVCISRRSLEILSWADVHGALLGKGLPWASGRSFFRNEQVLQFRMPSDRTQRFAPMLNLQQYYLEQFVFEAARRRGSLAQLRWATRVVALRQAEGGVEIEVQAGQGPPQTLTADYLVACDGARSTVREQLGLSLQGVQYDGRYVIVDIEQETQRETERLAWFDPPSNPGSTILMHRQPDKVWRIDYQLRDDEDPLEAVKPENVLPRVQRHLTMIGEHAPWKALWISIYNAKCLTLDRYRHGRVLLAGDAAHLVPIFGVRGLNSGLDDAANLAWKLAAVLEGAADPALLDTYSDERVQAARENIVYGAKSTEFMAPPNFAFSLMRDAALRLARSDARVRSLINPRQTAPVAYPGSSLNAPDIAAAAFEAGARPGEPAPEALLESAGGAFHLTQAFGAGMVLLHFTQAAQDGAGLTALCAALQMGSLQARALRIHPAGTSSAGGCTDLHGQAAQRYGAPLGALVVVRPDGYVLGRWARPDWAALGEQLAAMIRCSTAHGAHKAQAA